MSRRALLATAGAAFAFAAGAGGALADRGRGPHRPGGHGGSPEAAAIATYLGLSPAELRTQLRAGKTLAQIARMQGKSVPGLQDAIYAAAKKRFDRAVTNGRLTAAQEQMLLANLKSHLDDLVNRNGRTPWSAGARAFGAGAAEYLGLTEGQLRAQLRSGKTLAQVATAQGKSVEGLKAAILAYAKSRLDQAVAVGRLTAAQAEAIVARLTSHIDDLVNRTAPPHRRP